MDLMPLIDFEESRPDQVQLIFWPSKVELATMTEMGGAPAVAFQSGVSSGSSATACVADAEAGALPLRTQHARRWNRRRK